MEDRLKDIFEYWESNAEEFGDSHEVSWGDINMINLEIETISKYIPDGSNILDAGCANGYSTLNYLSRKPVSITGFDYSPKDLWESMLVGFILKFKIDLCMS